MKQSSSLSGLTLGISCGAYDGRAGQEMESASNGTSIFDPVLCEIIYEWFTAPGYSILDPFAGGSVRGICAAVLGRNYTGLDLRAEQCAANEAQAADICAALPCWAEWRCADSAAVQHGANEYDFLFSCPPYGDLEKYSDDPRDLSAMPHADFLTAYRHVIATSAAALRDNRFACFVVGDFRDRAGNYRNFTGETVAAFEAAGLHYYNEAVLLTAVGSLPVRVGRQFEAARKLGKTHQNVLVFVKGSGKRATDAIRAMAAGALAIFIAVVFPAHAAPPPGTDPNSEIAGWVHTLETPSGGLCCSLADCRPVHARLTPTGWEAWIDRRDFGPDAPSDWVPVPVEIVDGTRSDGDPPDMHVWACW